MEEAVSSLGTAGNAGAVNAQATLAGWSPFACTLVATLGTMPAGTMPAVGTSVLPSEDHAVLQACQLELNALSCASLLCEVIEQVEEGQVQRIQDKYGSKKGCPSHPLWENIKSTVNWQEWLYAQLKNGFAGEKQHFFDFFTCQPEGGPLVASSSKGKRKASSESLFPLHKVVEAISRWDKDLAGECYGRGPPYFFFTIYPSRLYGSLSLFLQ